MQLREETWERSWSQPGPSAQLEPPGAERKVVRETHPHSDAAEVPVQGDIQPRQSWEQTTPSISVTCSGNPHTSVIPAATVLCRRQPRVLSKPSLGPGQKEQESTKWVLPER